MDRECPHGSSSTTPPRSYDPSFELWQSTPVKKDNVGVFPADISKVSIRSSNEVDGRVRPYPVDNHCRTQLQHNQMSPVSDLESSTIQRQRRELQLMITELKDRDRELNTMAASHHKQLHAWEQDRQRVLSLERRCARSDEELQKCVGVIRALTRRVRVVEARDKDLQTELSTTQQQLQQLGQEHQDMERTSKDLQDKDASLTSTVLALSSQVGSLQVREVQLRATLQLKDKDVREAAAHMGELRLGLQDVEASLEESHSRADRLLRVVEETKRRYRAYRHENAALREDLQQHVTQSSAQREEIIRLKQEHQMLCRDLALSGEGDSWKDELLALARSKQERTESELHCLRQVCDNQQSDLQLLQLNLETARVTLGERSGQESVGGHDDSLTSSPMPRNCCLANNTKQPSTAVELLSHASNDGRHPSVSFCLQRALDDSQNSMAGLVCSVLKHKGSMKNQNDLVSLDLSHNSGLSEASHCPHTSLKSSCCSRTSTDKVTETPPKA
ncbi:coiled-coil domain-containing protein 62-like [Gadus chalcogrammus]|uniref:coiled-coil domain-containing protein 62-like n=1 Tax=Gadus chalcogrammus TaxID=1042646 RepID=UPI0024C498C7|nr:coiled-coil domain-containing protein 62-like [Gadus chalcogrammus]